MLWTTTNLAIQIVAGFVGAHLAAAALRDHGFGFWGHSLVGVLAGAIGGYFLQTYAATVVNGNGTLNDIRPVDMVLLQAVTGAALGGIVMMAIGMIMHQPKQD